MSTTSKSPEEIADMITEAVFAEGIAKKEEVRFKVLTFIKAFLKVPSNPLKASFDATPVKEGERAQLMERIQRDSKEKQFWKSELEKVIGKQKMEELYRKVSLDMLKDKFKPV